MVEGVFPGFRSPEFAHPEFRENLGDAAHVDDPVILTCLNQDMVGGLQVMNFSGDWIDAIVVNTGTYLEFIRGAAPVCGRECGGGGQAV